MIDPVLSRGLAWAPLDPATPDNDLARVGFTPDPTAAPWAMPLAPLGGTLGGERWLSDDAITADDIAGWQVRTGRRIAWAARHLPEPKVGDTLADVAARAYRDLFTVQRATGLAWPQRIWHVLFDVIGGDGEAQRYRQFCRGRAEALAEITDDATACWTPLPPATLVGGTQSGLWMHALLGDTPVRPIENPRQISAYAYPSRYAERPPAFARGGVITCGDARYLLISGTAAIVGHESRHAGDVLAQFDEALANVRAVIEAAAPSIGAHRLTDIACLKIYVRRPEDAAALLERAATRLPAVPLAALAATVCRNELLVEVEAHLRAA